MIRYLADENFDFKIVAALRQSDRGIDILTVHDVGLSGADDPDVLEWAAANGRIVLTHDVQTMTAFAYDRVIAGLPMPGVFEVSQSLGRRTAIDQLDLITHASLFGEYEGQIRYLPFF